MILLSFNTTYSIVVFSNDFSPSVPVSKPYIQQRASSAVEGLSFWMHCSLENGTEPIHYIWEQENLSGQISILAKSNSSLINMTLLTRNHTGWFWCLARNEVNQQQSDRLWLDVLCECLCPCYPIQNVMYFGHIRFSQPIFRIFIHYFYVSSWT